MFLTTKNKSYRESFSHRAGKATNTKKKDRSFRAEKELTRSRSIATPQTIRPAAASSHHSPSSSNATSPNVNSAIVTISVGAQQRLFAAHEDILAKSPYFSDIVRAQFFSPQGRRIDLPSEEPEIFSAVLEYLYKGDYSPRLAYDKKRGSWYLEDAGGEGAETCLTPTMTTTTEMRRGGVEDVVHQGGVGGAVLKDTIIYCSAHLYALPDLQRLALKKQGLATGVSCSTILSSARFAYAHTPASDSKLRAHYLALIIRSRSTFKRSGTMQMEMLRGGSAVFFDLFVAMVNHLDDLAAASKSAI